jgi:hypothetical protein
MRTHWHRVPVPYLESFRKGTNSIQTTIVGIRKKHWPIYSKVMKISELILLHFRISNFRLGFGSTTYPGRTGKVVCNTGSKHGKYSRIILRHLIFTSTLLSWIKLSFLNVYKWETIGGHWMLFGGHYKSTIIMYCISLAIGLRAHFIFMWISAK